MQSPSVLLFQLFESPESSIAWLSFSSLMGRLPGIAQLPKLRGAKRTLSPVTCLYS